MFKKLSIFSTALFAVTVGYAADNTIQYGTNAKATADTATAIGVNSKATANRIANDRKKCGFF